jgi:hypothetical protein
MDYSQRELLSIPRRRSVQPPAAWLDSRQISASGKIAIQSHNSAWEVAFKENVSLAKILCNAVVLTVPIKSRMVP